MSGRTIGKIDRPTSAEAMEENNRGSEVALRLGYLLTGHTPTGRTRMTVSSPQKAKEPHASIFRREDRFIVHSQSKTTVGVWIACDPSITLPMDASDAELGEAVLAALKETNESVPHPEQSERRKIVSPLLKAAQVRSWKAFSNKTISAGARQREQMVFLLPYENREPKGGFVKKQGCELAAPLGSAKDIGATLREALALAS